MEKLDKNTKELELFIDKFSTIEDAINAANEIFISLTQIPHVTGEISKVIYKKLDHWQNVLDELNEYK